MTKKMALEKQKVPDQQVPGTYCSHQRNIGRDIKSIESDPIDCVAREAAPLRALTRGLIVIVSTDPPAEVLFPFLNVHYNRTITEPKCWEAAAELSKYFGSDPFSIEAKTGQRRLIEYLLSPLLRFKQESARER